MLSRLQPTVYVEVLGPADLRKEVRNCLQETMDRYRQS